MEKCLNTAIDVKKIKLTQHAQGSKERNEIYDRLVELATKKQLLLMKNK